MIRAILGLFTLAGITIWCGCRIMTGRMLGQPDVPGGVYDRMLLLWSGSMVKVTGVH